MSRAIKFRAWDGEFMQHDVILHGEYAFLGSKDFNQGKFFRGALMQFTGLKDKNGVEIYEGDILEFTDKWEWYRSMYFAKFAFSTPETKPKIQAEYDAEPLERRAVEMPSCYEQFSQSELTSYWQVIGNIHQNPDLLS